MKETNSWPVQSGRGLLLLPPYGFAKLVLTSHAFEAISTFRKSPWTTGESSDFYEN